MKDKPRVFTISSFTDNGVKLRLVGMTEPGKQWEVRTLLLRELKLEFDEKNIKIPYSQIRIVN